MLTIVSYLAAQDDFKGTIYGFTKAAELESPADGTNAVIQAAANGEIETEIEQRGSKRVLTVSLSKRSVRKINRAKRAKEAKAVQAEVAAALEAERPQKIGTLVKATGRDRQAVLDALRAGREAGIFTSSNSTKSNFHMTWTLTASPEPFPVPEPEPEPEADADEAPEAPAAE